MVFLIDIARIHRVFAGCILSQSNRAIELIQCWQPWNKSTGAITLQGKAVSREMLLKEVCVLI